MKGPEFAPVPGYEGAYEVSSAGVVRSLRRVVRGRIYPAVEMATSVNQGGYVRVGLSLGGTKRTHSVHALVMAAFVGPPPAGMEVCHNDGDQTNNSLDNLRYDTPSANALDRVRHGSDALAGRTSCRHGHPFTPENTYVTADGARRCRTCQRSHQAAYLLRRAS